MGLSWAAHSGNWKLSNEASHVLGHRQKTTHVASSATFERHWQRCEANGLNELFEMAATSTEQIAGGSL